MHPATLEFLEHVKPLFSQHRGVVDFLVKRLAGCAERGVAGLLDAPAGTWLTPDAIWDHFEERVRERVESAPLSECVLGWWRAHAGQVFARADERALALRALKVLALGALFPYERTVSPREMAGLLAVQVTDLEPRVNALCVADVMARLATHGPYVTRADAADPLERGYAVRREEDAALVVRARVRELALSLEGRDDEIARAVTSAVDEPYLPLGALEAQGRMRRSVTWQHTTREGWVLASAPGLEDREALAAEVATTETDWVVLVLPPSFSEAPEPDLGGLPAAVWRPRPLSDLAFVTEARARQLLARQIAEGRVPRGEALLPLLGARLADDRRRLLELAQAAYREGVLHTPRGPLTVCADSAPVSLERVLETAAGAVLDSIFPEHFTVAPPSAGFGRHALEELTEQFFVPGQLPGGRAASPLKTLVEGTVKRLGLAHRGTAGWRLSLLDDSPAARLLALVERAPVAVESLYWPLRKGRTGLSRPVFETLLVGLSYAGHLVPLSGGRRLTAQLLSPDRIAQVRRDLPVPGPVLSALLELPLLPPRVRQTTGPAQARLVRDELVRLRENSLTGLAAVVTRLAHARRDPLLAHLDLSDAIGALDALATELAPVTAQTPPAEALGALHARLESAALLPRLARVPLLERFLDGDASLHAAATLYLDQPELDDVAAAPAQPASRESAPILAAQLRQLRADARDPALCLDPERFRAWRADVAAFQEAYQALYTADHAAARAPASLAAHAALAASPRWRFAEVLAASAMVVPPPALTRGREALAQAAAVTCTALTPTFLRTRARCVCGHRPGDRPAVADVPALEAWLEESVRSLSGQLAAPDRRAALAAAAASSSTHAAVLTRLLACLDESRPLDAPDLDALAAALGHVDAQAQAPTRVLDDLVTCLRDKTLPAGAILRLTAEWLAAPSPDALIRLTAGGPSAPPADPLPAWSAAHDIPLTEARPHFDPSKPVESTIRLVHLSLRSSGPLAPLRALARERVLPRVARALAEQSLSALAVATPALLADAALPDALAAPSAAGVDPYRRLIAAVLGVESALAAPAEDPESRFRALAPVPLAVDRLHLLAADLELSAELDASGVADRARIGLDRAAAAFAADYRAHERSATQPLEGSGSPRPIWLVDVQAWSAAWSRRLSAPITVTAVVDALRFDIFNLVETSLLQAVPLQPLASALAWALKPTLTRVNMPAFSRCAGLARICDLDAELHASAQSLSRLADSLVPALTTRLARLADAQAPGDLLVITADHGFTENPAWRPHGSHSRWRHGGLDPFEALVPLSLYRKPPP